MKAFVDPETCIGCELCAQTCPEVFEMNPTNGLAFAKNAGVVPAGFEEQSRTAAKECPVDAIAIEE
jgi:ferredoxin